MFTSARNCTGLNAAGNATRREFARRRIEIGGGNLLAQRVRIRRDAQTDLYKLSAKHHDIGLIPEETTHQTRHSLFAPRQASENSCTKLQMGRDRQHGKGKKPMASTA